MNWGKKDISQRINWICYLKELEKNYLRNSSKRNLEENQVDETLENLIK